MAPYDDEKPAGHQLGELKSSSQHTYTLLAPLAGAPNNSEPPGCQRGNIAKLAGWLAGWRADEAGRRRAAKAQPDLVVSAR